MRKSHRIASFLPLSGSKIEEVSQNCCVFAAVKFKTEEVSQNSFVFKLAERQIDRETATTTTTSTTTLHDTTTTTTSTHISRYITQQ